MSSAATTKNLFDVYFDGSYVGYAWAFNAFDAVQEVVGECAFDTDGHRDYRYTAQTQGVPA